MNRAWAIAAATAMCSIGMPAAPAATAQTSPFKAWTIAGAVPGERHLSLGPNDFQVVIESKLLPTVLAQIDGDIRDAAAKLSADKGSQFFKRAVIGGAAEFCSVRSVDRAHTKYLCLIDRQDDGVFDAYRVARSPITGFPSLSPAKPSEVPAPANIAYRILDPSAFTGDYKLRLIHLGRRSMFRRDASFQRHVGSDEGGTWLGPEVPLFFESLPKEAQFEGVTLQNFAVDGKKLQFDIAGEFTQGPVSFDCCASYTRMGF